MMTRRNKILAGVAALSFGFWMKVRTAYRRLRFRLVRVHLDSIGSDSTVTVDITMQMYNPTGIRLEVGHLNAGLYLEGVPVGSLVYDKEFIIEGNQVNTLTFTSSLNATQFGQTAWELLKTSQIQDWSVTVKGTAEIEGRTISIDYDYPLKNALK